MSDMKDLHKEVNEQKRMKAGTKVQNNRMEFLIDVLSDLNKENFYAANAGEDAFKKIDWMWEREGKIIPIQFKERPNAKFQDPFMETCLIFPLGNDIFETSYEWLSGRDFEGISKYTIFGLLEGMAIISNVKLKERVVEIFKEWMGDDKKVKFFKTKRDVPYLEPLVKTETISSWFRKAANYRGGSCRVFASTKMKGAEIWFRIDRSDRRGTYGKLMPYFPLEFLQPYGYFTYKDGENPSDENTWVKRNTTMLELMENVDNFSGNG